MEILKYTTVFLIVWMIGIVFLERKYPYRKGLPFFREGFWIDFVWYTLIQSYFLKILIFDYIIFPLQQEYQLSLESISLSVKNWPLVSQVLFFLITHDLYIYWFHRLQHTNKWFWRTHEAHHSGTQVDWLAGSRSHVLEILINQTIEFAPIILLGADPNVVPIKALIDATWGMYIHSNIDVKSGTIQYFINGPEMHQWHHADHKEVFFANYATKFSFWDWMFGTAYLPNHKPKKWGIPYAYPRDYFMQHAFSIVRFDERKLMKHQWFRTIYGLRFRMIRILPQAIQKWLLPDGSALYNTNQNQSESNIPKHFSVPKKETLVKEAEYA